MPIVVRNNKTPVLSKETAGYILAAKYYSHVERANFWSGSFECSLHLKLA